MAASSSAVTTKPLFYRKEFRQVLQKVVGTLRSELRFPGVSAFNPDELAHWFSQITVEDIQAVWNESGATSDC